MSKYEYMKSKRYENVYAYKTSKGIKYMFKIRYYDMSGKRKEKSQSGFDNEKLAYRKSLEMKIHIENGDYAKLDPTSITVGHWYDKWIEINTNWAENTKISRISVGNDFVKPLIGHIKLKDLNLIKYELLFIKELEKTEIKEGVLMSPATIDLYHTYMKICINSAVNRSLIPKNEIVHATLPTVIDKRVKYVSTKDLETILEDVYVNEPISNFIVILFLAYTGCRIGELQALQWKHVDLENRLVTIAGSRKHNIVSTTKNKKIRKLKISPIVIDHLRKYRLWCIQRTFQLGTAINDDSFVFISEQKGTKIAQSTITYCLKRVYKRTGIKITPHGFRHTHATILASENMSFSNIAKRLGNTPEVVMHNYAHVTDEMETQLVEVFDKKVELVEQLVEKTK